MRNEREDSGAKANPDVEAVTSRTAPTHESHSPLPWFTARNEVEAEYWWSRGGVTDRDCVVIAGVDRPVCSTNDDGLATVEDVANAAFIVRCVNSHDALIAALKNAEDTIREFGREFSSPRFTDRHGDGPRLLLQAKEIRAALAKAEATQ